MGNLCCVCYKTLGFGYLCAMRHWVIFYVFDLCFRVGPSIGYCGKVLLAFEDNDASKVGVRFDDSIPDGNNLGGLCEENHGFFCPGELLVQYAFFFFVWQGNKFSYVYLLHCAADCLCPENFCDDTEKLVINEIFEVGILIAFLGSM